MRVNLGWGKGIFGSFCFLEQDEETGQTLYLDQIRKNCTTPVLSIKDLEVPTETDRIKLFKRKLKSVINEKKKRSCSKEN